MFTGARFCILLALVPVPASAAIVVNGGFESAGLSGWSATGTVDGWQGSRYHDYIGSGVTPAQSGNTYAFFGAGNASGTNVLQQTIATTAGTQYRFSFDFVALGAGSQGLDYTFGGASGTISAVSTNNFSSLSTISGSFLATGATTTVSFRNISSYDNVDVGIDNVSVIVDPVLTGSLALVGAIPEPATWAMLISGFGLVGTALRRRRAAAITAA